MKKIFTLLSLFLTGMVAFADDYYVFCDKDGNVYENAASIVCSEVEEDDFGALQVSSGLYVKNVAAPSNYQVCVQANIAQMDNGSLQLCFPVNCVYYSTTGKQKDTSKGQVDAGSQANLMTEWFPTAYGTCVVTYTLKMYQNIFSKGERTITVTYRYADPSGIAPTPGSSPRTVAHYDLQGRRATPSKGALSIVRLSDGTVRKVLSR